MIDLLRNVVAAFARLFAPHAVVAAENLLLRHQLMVLRRSSPCPRLRRLDRWLIAMLATRTRSLLEAVIVVRPATVSVGIEPDGGFGGVGARAVGSAGRRSTPSCVTSSGAFGERTACGARTGLPASSRSSAGAYRRARSPSTAPSTCPVAAGSAGRPFSGTTLCRRNSARGQRTAPRVDGASGPIIANTRGPRASGRRSDRSVVNNASL